ncbi:lamin tail domain-containing protein [Psychroserpens sp.]
MKKIYTLLFTLLITSVGFAQLSTGDIAFTAFNADGDDDFAIVALADIPANTIIYFTDNEPATATTLTTGEGKVVWDSGGSIISAGTIIVFTDTDSSGNPNFGASLGTLTNGVDTGMNLAGGGDALFAYHGSDEDTVTTWLAGIQNEANNEGVGFVTTGLTIGTTFINYFVSGSPDGGFYSGDRASESLFADYLTLLGDNTNWTTNTSNGEALLPISTTAFTISGSPTDTEVLFTGTSASVSEGIGTFELEFTIINEDVVATTFEVALTVGDNTDIDSYVTETVTFPSGSAADQVVELTITDDLLFESDEIFTFEIQNVTGGSSAVVGTNNSFDLTITNNDAPPTIALPYTEDFSDCGTALWLPFSENTPADDVWTCAPGAFTMNGFGDEDDVDWLISNFSIDFDLTSNENIAVTTSERFGDAINDFEEFELRYSTDYPGFGDPTGFTWTALTFDPNNTSTGATFSTDSVTVVDASGITGVAYLAFFYDGAAGSGPEEWNIINVLIQEGALPTIVEFVSTSASVAEDSGTYDLVVSIANEDATNDTTFDVVLTAGDNTDIDGFISVPVAFLSTIGGTQNVTVTITDDILEELDETFTFEIQNVAGGNAAVVGTNTTFDLTILENDEPVLPGTLYDADFSNDGDGFPAHTTASPPVAGPTSVGPFGTAPNSWSLSYDTTPGSDTSANNFEVLSGDLFSQDWGGQGIFTSQVIDVTGLSVVDITATGINVGANENNFIYFYSIDGAPRVETSVTSTNGDPVNYALTGINVSGATDLEVGFEFSENGSNDGYSVSEFLVIEGATNTSVQFASTSDSVLEGAGTYDLTFEILFEDALNDTTFDVVLTAGDVADINTYTTQTVTFLAGTSAAQTVTVTITDDLIDESNEVFTFEIQNVAGGDAAVAGVNNSFDLTILDNDGFNPLPGDIVISEIMFNSSGTDDEWIELYNASGADITLNADWRLNYGSNSFDFGGTVIVADSYLTVALGSDGDGTYNDDNPFTPDVSTFSTPATAGSTNDSNNLGNTSATIELIYEPSGANTTIDTVTYDDGNPDWHTAADGNGPSLELIDLSFDNTLGASWVTSGSYDGGTPGTEYVAPVVYTYNGAWSPSDPSGTATAGDDIVIESGNASITSNTTCNSVTVNPGAALTIDTAVTLAATNGMTLESSSTSYSSLLGNGTVAGNIDYDRFVNSNALGNDLVSAPLAGEAWTDFLNFPNNVALLDDGGSPVTTYAFGPFDKITGTFQNYDENTVATLTSGVGYRAATDNGEALRFQGTVNTGTVTVDIIVSGPLSPVWNLVGNPYPSYLNVQSFLSHDVGGGVSNIQLFDAPTAAVYGYDGSATNGWTIYNLANTTASTVIAPGQGFFVSADATNAPIHDLEFTQAMRTSGTADDFISGRNAELTYLKLKASTANNAYITEFYFNANATESFDVGYDAAIYGDTTPDFAIYSHLMNDNTGIAMTLQAVSTTDISDINIPLGVNANQGEQLRFSIADMALPASVNVYLEDIAKNTVTLLNNSDYVITPDTALSGTGRFFLRTSEDALSTIDNSLNALNIFALNSSKELIVSGQLKENTILNLYDIQGRNVVSIQLDNTNLENRIDMSSISGGVYIVAVKNNSQQKTQKIIIN